MSIDSVLPRLERWYAARCDGAWEHDWGIKIETLDNPGWLVRIDLTGTPWAGRVYPTRKEGIDEAGRPVAPSWIHCFTQDGLFLGAGDTSKLPTLLGLFLDWVEAPADPAQPAR